MLANGQLEPTDMAWYAGADEWKPLKDLFEADSPPSVPAEPAVADQSDPPDEDPDDPDKIHVTRRRTHWLLFARQSPGVFYRRSTLAHGLGLA